MCEAVGRRPALIRLTLDPRSHCSRIPLAAHSATLIPPSIMMI